MDKNILGDRGAELRPQMSTAGLWQPWVFWKPGAQRHPPSDDPREILEALVEELDDGERTVIWRGAFNVQGTSPASWLTPVYQNPAALAKAWELYIEKYSDQPRSRPRLAVEAAWRQRRDLFDLDALTGWLGKYEVGCQAWLWFRMTCRIVAGTCGTGRSAPVYPPGGQVEH
jgi:hypothetical protein